MIGTFIYHMTHSSGRTFRERLAHALNFCFPPHRDFMAGRVLRMYSVRREEFSETIGGWRITIEREGDDGDFERAPTPTPHDHVEP